MSADRRAEHADFHRIAIIAALAVERASFARAGAGTGDPALLIRQSGPGAPAAARAARAALTLGADAIVAWGLAGGLDPRLATGSVILPKRVCTPEGQVFGTDDRWRAALGAAMAGEFSPCDADLLSVPAALESVAGKRAAAATSGAAAVDMESAAIAAEAIGIGVPFVAIRVIVDAHDDALPAGAERWIDARGERRLAPALGAALRPAEWRALWRLARRYRVARRVLERLAAALVARRFCVAAPIAAHVG